MSYKFDSRIAESLYSETPDEEIGSVSEIGWFGLYRNVKGYAGVIIREDGQGFVYSYAYSSEDELAMAWGGVINDYELYDADMYV